MIAMVDEEEVIDSGVLFEFRDFDVGALIPIRTVRIQGHASRSSLDGHLDQTTDHPALHWRVSCIGRTEMRHASKKRKKDFLFV